MKVIVSGVLLRFAEYNRQIELSAATVNEALQQLVERYPALDNVIFDGARNVRSAHRLFLNGTQLSEVDEAELDESDTLEILSAIAGG